MMRRLISMLLLLPAFPALAQHNVPLSNGNSMPLNNQAVPQENSKADTVRLELKSSDFEEIQITTKSVRKEKESKMRQAPVFDAVEEKKAEGTVPSQEEQYKVRFESSQMNSSRQYNRRSATPAEQTTMDAGAAFYRNNAPNSFESHFFTYLSGHYNTELYPDLKAAAEMHPENPEVQQQLAAYHIITGSPVKAVTEIKGLINNGKLTAGQLAYAEDLLLSADTGSTIVLHGFEDMFATYYVQNTSSVRTDVQLLSLDFMQSPQYREQWKTDAWKLPETNMIDTAYLESLCSGNPDKLLQLSMTLPRNYFVAIQDRLYPVGLTFCYSEELLLNFEANERLWKSTLKKELINRKFNDSGDQWGTNYLPMLLSLRRQYEILGRKEELEAINTAILKVGEHTNTTEKVKKYVK